jgi:small-conductance mechanosensitive channel
MGEILTQALDTNTIAQEIFGNFSNLNQYFTLTFATRVLQTLFALIIFYIIYRVARKYINKLAKKQLKPQTSLIVDKIIKYAYEILVVIYVLNLFGIKLDALLGAAGIVGIAVGFAAQTSVSNIISGIFVLSDQSIKIGDYITIGDVTGTVHSVDLMSIKILTPDNQLIRVPNETVIQSNMQNNTYFPTRRMTFNIGVSYDTDLDLAKKTLELVPTVCPTVLDDPAPLVYFDSYGDSSINMVLAVWFKREYYWDTRNTVFMNIKTAFDATGIEIPFNQIDVNMKGYLSAIDEKKEQIAKQRDAKKDFKETIKQSSIEKQEIINKELKEAIRAREEEKARDKSKQAPISGTKKTEQPMYDDLQDNVAKNHAKDEK